MKLFRIGIHEKALVFSEKKENQNIYDGRDILTKLKCEIDKCDQKKWEEAKRKVNPYEYIYTSSKTTNNICLVTPISRSYFKLHEMIKNNNILKNQTWCACLAEGPGGFIHCINQLSKYEQINIKKVYGITLISNDRRIPYWNQNILKHETNDIINGADNTGNLYNHENVTVFINRIGENKCHLVTADGGFDNSSDYNSQETASYKLIYCEIYTALNIQEQNGSFIVKIFDLFSYKTIQLLYLLYNCYSIVEIYKPLTSRLSNSEKYIICSGFRECPDEVIDVLKKYYDNCETLHIDVPESFMKEINVFNELFVGSQMKTIKEILKMIKEKSVYDKEGPSIGQIEKAMKWCEDYHLPVNEKCIFLK
jgi:23S rRNA U2552 (ribose-2'-O)-methylase RlmE/FtsJ